MSNALSNSKRFLSSILKIPGIKRLILVDKNAGIFLTKNIENPEKLAGMISNCGSLSHLIGGKKMKFIIFSRESRNDFLIFPVGKYYLGVIKQTGMDNILLSRNIMKFLKDFHKQE